MKDETRSFYLAAVEKTVRRIVDSLDEALDLEALARAAALSPFHFHRVFRGLLGETPLELHRRLRLERAAARLRDSDAGVTAIAFEAGYDTHEAFTRAFRAAYGAPPSSHRRGGPGCGGPAPLAAPNGIHFGSPELRLVTGGENMDVQIENRPALRLASVHHVGPYHTVAAAFQKLHELAVGAGLFGPDVDGVVAVYHDDPETTPAAELRADAALVVPEGVALPAGLAELRLPAGRYARTTHVGSYQTLGDTWTRFMGQWLPASGQRVGEGTTYEVYRNMPGQVPEAELRTDLYLPLAG